MKFDFRLLSLTEFEQLIKWAAQEGWDPGLNDATIFYNCFPEAFYGYFDQDRLIAGGSIVNYNQDFGFMGFFIVHPDYRGIGIGQSLWFQRRDLLLNKLKSGASIGMDGVLNMQKFYTAGGFELSFRDERRVRLGEKFDIVPAVQRINENTELLNIIAYDKICFGFDRNEFIKSWLTNPLAVSFYSVNEKGIINGFAVLRKTFQGHKIGPLFADNFNVAETLYQACLNEVPEENVFLDIPTSNTEAVLLSNKYNTDYVFECARMYYGSPPAIPIEKIFGITTFELG
jgi:GNAT superfamily N-acetyltransferase